MNPRTLAALLISVVLLLAGGYATAAAEPPASLPTPHPPAARGAASLTPGDVDAWLDGLLPAAIDAAGIPGATVAVVKDGKVVTTRGYGYADLERRLPVDPDRTLFRIGSVSKTFTATAVLQLVADGRLDLDTDIARHLDFRLPRRFDEPITLRHLLSHTAGFEERIRGLIGTESTPLRNAVAVDPPEQLYRPGTVPAYSNYGYSLAGYIVGRVSGMSYEDYVQTRVIDKAGLINSTVRQPLPAGFAERLALGYPATGRPPIPFEMVADAPAGAVSATGGDLARYLLAHLDGRLLDPATAELLGRPALDATTLGTLAEGPRMTLGFFQEDRNGHRILGHGGDTTVFHSHLQLYPDDATGIAVSFNGSGRTGVETVQLRQSILDGFADRYFPADRPATQPGTPTAHEHAALAAGSYKASRSTESTFLAALGLIGQTRLTAQPDGTLLVTPGLENPEPTTFTEVRPWVWQEVGGQRVITMRVVDSKVEAIGFAGAFALLPVPPLLSSGVVLPALLGALTVLALGLVAVPARALIRRRYGIAANPAPGGVIRVLTRIGAGCALLATTAWLIMIQLIMGFTTVPEPVIRGVQAIQAAANLAVVPAVIMVVQHVRQRAGAARIAGSALVALALITVALVSGAANLLAPSVSY